MFLTSSRMPGNHVHGDELPATFVPGRRNVFEGYWAANNSYKVLHKSFVRTSLGKKNQSEKHSTSKPNRFATIPPHTLVSCTCPMLRHRRRSCLCRWNQRLGNTRDRFLNEQNHLSYQKPHLRKRLVVLVLLKTR